MTNLHERSIEIILEGQAASGAYIASPNFSQYRACWLRDGTWIAYAMDCVGQHDSARKFYEWTDRTLRGYAGQVDALIAKLARNETPDESDYLPTRFTLDGRLVPGHWGDFQLDGYGTWLWGLVQHVVQTDDDEFYSTVHDTVQLVTRYLAALWQQPNYDCWEENREHIHPATLAAIYGGLNEIADPALNTRAVADAVRQFTLERGVTDGHFVKYFGNPAVDSSLLWTAVPYGLVGTTDPLFEETLRRIEDDLHRPGGGVYRYRKDVYFGGGEWLLLTAWLGWVYVMREERERAAALLDWIETQADAEGLLPEQMTAHPLAPEHYQMWVDKWGVVANPLLWSHAMYLIFVECLNSQRNIAV